MLFRAVVAASLMVLAAGPAAAGYLNNQLNQAWASFRDLTSAEFSTRFTEMSNGGYRMIDVDAYPNGSGLLYSQVWEKNSDTRAWAEYRGMTSAEYGTRWTAMRDAGYRPSDFESYQSGSTQLYAGIWVKNTENWSWSSRRDMTATQYGQYFIEQSNAGRRPIDIEVYQTSGGLRYAAIWYQNASNISWVQIRDMSRATYQTELDAKTAAGFRPIDFESYLSGGIQRYAAIWERNPTGRSWTLRSDRTELEYANLWRQYRDQGYRLVDFERYNTASGPRYAGLWVENDSRFDYSRKGTLDSLVSNYRSLNNLPGISVAVIRNGSMIYRRGFGFADINDGKVAHGESVYNAASVAKVISATLAAKLEAEDRLRDGSTFSLDLTQRTASFLTSVTIPGGTASIPSFHAHRLDQLLSHLGCVAHYDTTPAIPNQTTHRATALDAVRSIWNTGLVQNCTIGTTKSYSTPGFTFVAAAIEQVTHRFADSLIRTELSQPYGLSSLRVQYESATLPADYDRATPYNDNNTETIYENNSWKLWSGGMELNAVDLANFGWKVLSAQIVTATVRDNRLWAAVAAGCGTSTSGKCLFGLGWARGTIGGRRIVEHEGSWTGANAFIRVYRDDGLVIAIMSNRTNHTQGGKLSGLTTNIANAVLAP